MSTVKRSLVCQQLVGHWYVTSLVDYCYYVNRPIAQYVAWQRYDFVKHELEQDDYWSQKMFKSSNCMFVIITSTCIFCLCIDASKIAIELMLQGEVGQTTPRLLALYACSLYLEQEKETLLAPFTEDDKPVPDDGEDEYVVSLVYYKMINICIIFILLLLFHSL